jgi:uncharacterized membrane protein YhfC
MGLVISFVITLIVELVVPLALAIILVRRFKISYLPVLIGAGIFFVVQLLQVPILQWLSNLVGDAADEGMMQTVLDALVMGVSAGVFVETARMLVMKYVKQVERDLPDALAIGVGYGAAETILLVGLPVLTSFITMLSYRSVTNASLSFSADMISQIKALWSLPWYTPLLGAFERLTALLMHVTLSVMVVQVFIKGKMQWLFAAMGWHMLYESLSIFLSGLATNAGLIEGMLLVITVVNLLILKKLGVFSLFRKSEMEIVIDKKKGV